MSRLDVKNNWTKIEHFFPNIKAFLRKFVCKKKMNLDISIKKNRI